ncbi:MAG: hypothetical protein IE885_03420 [Campylobacterales bacterium]|nr:hypothetical protein [Campylobacterales bacterium]
MFKHKVFQNILDYLDPLRHETNAVKNDFKEWDKTSQVLQIRSITLLTASLYIIYAGMDHEILVDEALSFATFMHLYFLPILLSLIAIISFSQKLYKPMIGLLMLAPVIANIGNLYLNTMLRTGSEHLSEIYLPEIYLSMIWIFAISGLRFYEALISGMTTFIIFLAYQSSIDIPKEIFYLHFLWIFIMA